METFTRTVHCVGIKCTKKRNYLLMQVQKRRPASILIIPLLLDETSAHLTSPFYEHDVVVREEGDSSYHVLEEWKGAKLRINMDTDRQDTTFVANIRTVVRHTFFPMLQRTATSETWQKDLYPWDIYYKGLAWSYRSGFDLEKWLTPSDKCLATDFWAEFKDTYKEELKESVDALGANSQNSIVGSLPYIYGLLDRWNHHTHIGGYFKYRLLEMVELSQILDHNFPSLPPLSHHPTGVIKDVATFCKIITKSDDVVPEYHNFPKLVTAILTKIPKDDWSIDFFIEQVLVRYMTAALEKQLQEGENTILPVTPKNILWNYHYIMGIKKSSEEPHTLNLTNYQTQEEEVVEKCIGLMCDNKTWQSLSIDRECLKSNAPLFFLRREEENQMEEKIHNLFMEKMVRDVRTFMSEEWDRKTWQDNYMVLDDVELALYDKRFTLVRYTVEETKRNLDLIAIKEVLMENIWQSIILRPEGSNYSLRRASLYFAEEQEEVSLDDFHERFLDVKEALMEGETAVKELVIVMDCHLLPLAMMVKLMEWFSVKGEIRRVVMMGVHDVLPLGERGQAFLDLVQWVDYGGVNATLFHHDQFHASLLNAIDQSLVMGKTLFLSHYKNIEPCLREQLTLLEERRPLVKIFLLVSQGEASNPHKKPTMDSLREYLTLKFISIYNIRLFPVTLTQLTTLNQTDSYGDEWILFFISQHYLKQLNRNEVNHLLLGVHNLTVLSEKLYDSKKTLNTGWFKKSIKLQKYPNIRYTLPYARRIISTSSL